MKTKFGVDVQFADNPPDKRYIVVMLIPCGLGICVARSTQYTAYTENGAIDLARVDNPSATILHVERVKVKT